MGKISLFKKLKDTTNPYFVSLEFALNRIKTGHQKDLVEKIRTYKDKSDRNVLKSELNCICFSGEFSIRKAEFLVSHSGYICFDFDNFETSDELNSFREKAMADVYTLSLFLSPSGNGFKMLVKIPTDDHLGSFLALQDYYEEAGMSKRFDKATKDVNRVCYMSYDEDLFYNPNSEVFEGKRKDIVNVESHKKVRVAIQNNNEVIAKLISWWDRDYGFVQGEKNNNLFILANAFNQYGISQSECEGFFQTNYFQPPCKDPSEISSIVSNAYKNVGDYNTKQFEDRDKITEIALLSHKGRTSEEIAAKMGISLEDIEDVVDSDEMNQFWTVSSKGVVKTVFLKYKMFLENNGFYKYRSQDLESDEFVFVRVKNNLIENIMEIDIKDFVLNFLEAIEDKRIYEHFAKNSSSHFTDKQLNIVGNVKVNLRLDSKNIGYVYYKNCVVKITPTEIKTMDYIDLDGAVWKSHVLDRDFHVTDNLENDYKKFVWNISKEGRSDVLKSAESALGYLMHNYNDRKTQKAIILNDSKQTGSSEEGGIGKGLFVQGIEQIRRTIVEDGKDFDDSGQFKYQRVGLDTQVFSFDDVPKSFNFLKLFSVITEGMTIEKKNKQAVKLKYSDSPKIVLTTNYVIKGRGNSHNRRKFEIEFGEHYGSHLTPFQEFKQELFLDWDADHFNRFDNYMITLIQAYMNTGLIESKSDTAMERKLIAQTDPLFVGWMSDIIETLDSYHGYLDLHRTCLEESGLGKVPFKEFSLWVEDYCELNGYISNIIRIQGKLSVRIDKVDVKKDSLYEEEPEF